MTPTMPPPTPRQAGRPTAPPACRPTPDAAPDGWRSRLQQGLATACIAGLLAACGTRPAPPRPEPAPAPPPAQARPEPAVDAQLLAFERRQAAAALEAEARGHWDQAARARELLALVRPDDPAARGHAAEARERARREAARLAEAAQAARRRGDLDGAAQGYLEALVQDPDLRSAAEALRQVELDRERRRLAARNARLGAAPMWPPARRPGDEAPAGAAAPATDADAGRRLAAAREHATLLARQGDIDAAIQVLREVVTTRSEQAARLQLADLHVQKAESLRHKDVRAALAAVEAALALERRHGPALALQRQLAPGAAGVNSKGNR